MVGFSFPLSHPPHEVQRALPGQRRRVAVRAADVVPQGEVLAVVVVEEEVVVRVVGGAVDERLEQAGHAVVSVVDGDGPHVDEDVQAQVQHLVMEIISKHC